MPGAFEKRARRARSAVVSALPLVALLLPLGACQEPRLPIEIDRTSLRVRNTTTHEWSDVEIRVNDHYRGAARSLAPGGELVVPLRNLVAGFGQQFDPARQTVRKVEVTATGAGGTPVLVQWPTTDD